MSFITNNLHKEITKIKFKCCYKNSSILLLRDIKRQLDRGASALTDHRGISITKDCSLRLCAKPSQH